MPLLFLQRPTKNVKPQSFSNCRSDGPQERMNNWRPQASSLKSTDALEVKGLDAVGGYNQVKTVLV